MAAPRPFNIVPNKEPMEASWRRVLPASARFVPWTTFVTLFTSTCLIAWFITSIYGQSSSTNRTGLLSFTPAQLSSASASASSPDVFTFTIIQIADLHLGEAQDRDWGPEQDRKTYRALTNILKYQKNANYIVLSGDQLTANNVHENATAYYKRLADFIDSYHIPWSLIFGNHDDSDLVYENGTTSHAKTSRKALMQSIQHYTYGMTKQDTPDDVFGVSNYVVNVTLRTGEVGMQLLFLDSGGGHLPSNIQQSQLDWIASIRLKDTPAVAFQHIPTQQYTFNNKDCVGSNGDGGFAPLENDAGIVNHLINDGNVHFLAVGHNHGNSYCCPIQTFSLCFGRHSGYGGYGKFDRGARVYEMTLNAQYKDFTFKSWIQMESGEVVEEYIPKYI